METTTRYHKKEDLFCNFEDEIITIHQSHSLTSQQQFFQQSLDDLGNDNNREPEECKKIIQPAKHEKQKCKFFARLLFSYVRDFYRTPYNHFRTSKEK